MKIRIEIKNLKVLFMYVAIGAFLVTKIERGFLTDAPNGGIWNYIQIAFVLLGTIAIFTNYNLLMGNRVAKIWMLFTVYMMINALLSTTLVSTDNLFSIVMIPYACCTFSLFLSIYASSDDKAYRIIIVFVYYLISVLFSRFMLNYYQGNGVKNAISNAYYCVSIVPLIIALTTGKRKIVPMLCAFVTVALSSKRAGLLGLTAAIIVYYLIKSIYSNKKLRGIRNLIVILIVAIALYWLINFLDEKYQIGVWNRIENISNDEGSGRGMIWELIIIELRSSNLFQIIFGHGYGSIRRYIGMEAHNDFLQLLFEGGLIACSIYVSYYIAIISELIVMIKKRFVLAPELAMSIVISLTFAIFSFYVIEPTFITCGMLCQAYIFSEWYKENEIIKEYESY